MAEVVCALGGLEAFKDALVARSRAMVGSATVSTVPSSCCMNSAEATGMHRLFGTGSAAGHGLDTGGQAKLLKGIAFHSS